MTPKPRGPLKWLLLVPAAELIAGGQGALWLLWLAVLVIPSVWKGPWRWRWPAVLLTPLFIYAGGLLSGAWGYVTGTGQLLGYGLPKAEYFNLNPKNRLPHWNLGCCQWGFEDLALDANNAALRWLAATFGPMRGSYLGPCPTREQARHLVGADAEPLSYEELESGRIHIQGRDFVLPRAWPYRITHRVGRPDAPTRAAWVAPGLLAIEIVGWYATPRVSLLDLEGGHYVATYEYREESQATDR